MLFHIFKPLEQPALIFLQCAAFAELVGMLMPLQNGFFLGLFFVNHEPDVECLQPAPLAQLVQPRSWRRGSSPPGIAMSGPATKSFAWLTELAWRASGCSIPINVFRHDKKEVLSYEQHLNRTPWGIRAVKAEWQTSFGR